MTQGRAAEPERPPLPSDPSTLPPLDPAFARTLEDGLRALRIELAPGQRAAIDAHARLLLAWNAAINLTALRRPDQVALDHVIDSLTAATLIGTGTTLLDMGSGGGYPGLPLAVVARAGNVALVESIAKKARFLDVAARAATAALTAAGEPPPTFLVLPERAESLAARPEHRQGWDVVTARAVAGLAELVELAFPLLRVGGRLIAWKRDQGPEVERGEAEAALRALGSDPRSVEVSAVTVAGLEDHRLVVIRKTGPTPRRYPRPVAERRRAAPA
jgi:16S rRNA (guanine527-N7)-methyltransferase